MSGQHPTPESTFNNHLQHPPPASSSSLFLQPPPSALTHLQDPPLASTLNILPHLPPPAFISSLHPSHYTLTLHHALDFNSPAAAAALLPDRISMSKRSRKVIADGVHSYVPKRLSFSSMVFMSLSNAIESWENARKTMALHPLPKVNILASVVKWGVPKKCRGIIT
jgi:hypothetical protein